MKVRYEDAELENLPADVTVIEAIKAHSKDGKVAKGIVAATVNGVQKDLGDKITTDDVTKPVIIEAIELGSAEGVDILRHSLSHIMAQAVKKLYKEARLGIGPTIENGFYYDFEIDKPFTPEDIERIEKEMGEIMKANLTFQRIELSREDAIKLFTELKEDYKVELITELPEDETISIYKQGEFTDLCRGPHLQSTGKAPRSFKLLTSAGAYWKGDEKNTMLQRIYGVAFSDKKELKEHLKNLEEAKKRDHRKLGKELDLFSISENMGPGLVLWHPNGALIRTLIEDFWRSEHTKSNYSIIYTPHIAKVGLWEKSGHWDFYRENLFSPMDVDGQDYIVKPMNCPFHIEIFNSTLRSYRELPVRYAELGTVYRYERSGVLHGLLRVRGFTQDDAHIYMTLDQLPDEIKGVLDFTLYILKSFGFNEYEIYLSTRPEKYVGDLSDWEKAEEALKWALESSGLPYSIDPGEGVFYGPKIDIKIKDVLGRAWQCSTIQVDFNLPERFDITYRDNEGKDVRPIMIHRALMGSLERFFGCLIEHYAGAFPVWLSPVQATILTVTDRVKPYAEEVLAKLRAAGLRADIDGRNEKLGFKIREARLKKIPYMVVIGDKEDEENIVAPRSRDEGELGEMKIEELIERISNENKPLT
ncbi:MAG: threonine--tRNA ligase [Deltaproteobacteria bacterium]|nr:threonine--tRNA ligase [Deltaproteobacteria bacterium]